MRETIAIVAYNRKRQSDFLSALFSVVDPKEANKLMKDYRVSLFPEEKYDDIAYLKAVKEQFVKLRKMKFTGRIV